LPSEQSVARNLYWGSHYLYGSLKDRPAGNSPQFLQWWLRGRLR